LVISRRVFDSFSDRRYIRRWFNVRWWSAASHAADKQGTPVRQARVKSSE
jgi:hypothetical protein